MKLTWVDPVSFAPDTLVVRIFDSASPGAPIGEVKMGVQEFLLGVLSAGSHTFSTVVFDSKGNASAPDVAPAVVIPIAPPNPTTNIQVLLDGDFGPDFSADFSHPQ